MWSSQSVIAPRLQQAAYHKDGLNIVYALQDKLLVNEYYATGDFVARAFAVGKTIKRQN